MILGCSVTSLKQAKAAEAGGADYIAVGSMYPTLSKETAKVVGPEMLRRVRGAVGVPLVAIGGINRDNAGEVAAAGADGVAVISAILGAEDVEAAARQVIKAFEAGK
jgi:thiamine-phosphate diphosphorylase